MDPRHSSIRLFQKAASELLCKHALVILSLIQIATIKKCPSVGQKISFNIFYCPSKPFLGIALLQDTLLANKFFLFSQRKTTVLMQVSVSAVIAENREPILLNPYIVGHICNFSYDICSFISCINISNAISYCERNFTGYY